MDLPLDLLVSPMVDPINLRDPFLILKFDVEM